LAPAEGSSGEEYAAASSSAKVLLGSSGDEYAAASSSAKVFLQAGYPQAVAPETSSNKASSDGYADENERQWQSLRQNRQNSDDFLMKYLGPSQHGGSSSSKEVFSASTSAGTSSPTPSGAASSSTRGSPASSGRTFLGYGKPLPNVADIVVAGQRPTGVPVRQTSPRNTKNACPTPWNAECNDECECDSIWARYCVARHEDGEPSDALRV